MSFKLIKTAPKKGNKYYNTTSNGGYSNCIVGNYPYNYQENKRTGIDGLNVLPNCVGFICGLFNEQGGYGKIKYNLNCNAKDIIDRAKQLGLKTGKTPKLGCLMVWTNGKYGHVASVTDVISASEIKVIQSGWNYKGSTGVWTAIHKKGTDGNWIIGDDFAWMSGRYTFLGCVYHPDAPTQISKIKTDGIWGSETTKSLQTIFGTTVDGIISGQSESSKAYCKSINSSTWKFVKKNPCGSNVIRALQIRIGANSDGYIGPNTIKSIQKYLKNNNYYNDKETGILDKNTVKSLQTYINDILKDL